MAKNLDYTKPIGILYIVFIYAITTFLMKNYFNNIYLIEWLSRHIIYEIVFLISIIHVALNKFMYSKTILLGNIAGIFTGIFVGDLIYNANSSKITSSMDAELVYKLSTRYDVFIWILTILLVYFFVLGISRIKSKK